MICPFCKEEIADGALKCKHCESTLNEYSKISANTTTNTNRERKHTISPRLQKKFDFFNEHEGKPGFWGPSFSSNVSWTDYANWFALFFNCWYYVFTGMWKKGLALMGLAIVASLIGEQIYPSLGQIGALVSAIICLLSAYHDKYRKEILNEDFWW